MNSENFHEYLKNPSKLHQVSYQELKSLVMQYPYSPNLRFLLLLKSLFDQNKDYERNLVLAALHTPDRKKLRKLVMQYGRLQEIQENYALTDDFLELKDLSNIDDVLEKLPRENVVNAVSETLTRDEMNFPDLEAFAAREDKELSDFLEEADHLDFLEDVPDVPEESTVGMPHSDAGNDGERNDSASPSVADIDGASTSLEDLFSDPAVEIEPEEETSAGLAGAYEAINPDMLESVETLQEETEPFLDEHAHNPSVGLAVEEEAGASADQSGVALPETEDSDEREEAGQDVTPVISVKDIPLEITNEQPADIEENLHSPVPLPKAAFGSWANKFQPPKPSLLESRLKDLPAGHRHKHEPRMEEEDEANYIAGQSVAEDHEITSETLALVLSTQGHYEKAISMYERLCLQYPEKSSFFAAKIEMLKKKIV